MDGGHSHRGGCAQSDGARADAGCSTALRLRARGRRSAPRGELIQNLMRDRPQPRHSRGGHSIATRSLLVICDPTTVIASPFARAARRDAASRFTDISYIGKGCVLVSHHASAFDGGIKVMRPARSSLGAPVPSASRRSPSMHPGRARVLVRIEAERCLPQRPARDRGGRLAPRAAVLLGHEGAGTIEAIGAGRRAGRRRPRGARLEDGLRCVLDVQAWRTAPVQEPRAHQGGCTATTEPS